MLARYLKTRKKFEDERGWFTTLSDKRSEQINMSFSKRGVARGIHYQPGQGKTVTVVKGHITDYVVCLDPSSPDFGKAAKYELTEESGYSVVIPSFNHGHAFYAHEDSIVVYSCTDTWEPLMEVTIDIMDTEIKLDIPVRGVIRSLKDERGITLDTFKHKLLNL